MPATRKDRWRPENDLVTMGQPLHLTSIDNKFSAAPPKHPRWAVSFRGEANATKSNEPTGPPGCVLKINSKV